MKRPRKPLPKGARSMVPPAASQFCPTCGHSIIPYLSPIRRRMLNAIERHGEIDPVVLWNVIWGSDPNGGPPMDTLHVHIWHLNKDIARWGMAVRRTKRGVGGMYRLVAEAAE